MELVDLIKDLLIPLWNCTATHTGYIRHLGEKIELLRGAKGRLHNTIEKVKREVERDKEYYEIRNEVKDWLAKVDPVMKKVDDTLQKANEEIQNKCLGSCCPRNCWTSYWCGKEVIEKIKAVDQLIQDGNFSVVAGDRLPLTPGAGDEQSEERTVEIDSKVREVWEWIEDGSVGIIGLYGMGGVGKTNLLRKLHSKFMETSHQNMVMWLTVSRELKEESIQNSIATRLEIPDNIWKPLDELGRVTLIHKMLRSRKFVLLLDDLWAHIDLRSKVGIPTDHLNGSKIILTTRLQQVCNSMGVERIYKVPHLLPEAALELFRQKVTEKVYSLPGIQKLVDTVAEECKGLPLALITIGSAMSGKTSPAEWRAAINKLKNYPSKLFEDMGKDIFGKLMFSYESFPQKECFLYCSTFPEDHEIRKDELIDLWIAEGILDDYATLDEKRDEGRSIIESLKRSSLLERVEYSSHHVKMHDVLRDMALCIASKEGKEIVVYDDCRSFEEYKEDRWQNTVRISLWGRKIRNLPKIWTCRNLHTFLARGTAVETFPNGFFQSTLDALNVLDLQDNPSLMEPPNGLSKLIKLQYLNLSDTGIKMLPIEFQNLRQLKILLLDGTSGLESVAEGVISSLSSLQVFSRLSTRYHKLTLQPFWDTTLLEELECLEHIREIGLTLFSLEAVSQFQSSLKLRTHVKRLIIDCLDLLSLDISPSTMSSAVYFQNLHDLYITNCSVKDLTCLMYSPRLRFVYADNCLSLEEIFAWDVGSSEIEAQEVFQHLKQLNFRRLPCLQSICGRALPFPSLERIFVEECKNLRKLPLKSVNGAEASTSTIIMGEEDWWNQLEWEDEATKQAFSSKFSPLNLSSRVYYFVESPSYTYEATEYTRFFQTLSRPIRSINFVFYLHNLLFDVGL